MNGFGDLISIALMLVLVVLAPLLYDLATALNLAH